MVEALLNFFAQIRDTPGQLQLSGAPVNVRSAPRAFVE